MSSRLLDRAEALISSAHKAKSIGLYDLAEYLHGEADKCITQAKEIHEEIKELFAKL